MSSIYYFAYGADMLHQKMKLHSFPSELKGNGTLRGWKLVFVGEDPQWKGAAASVQEDNHLAKLDAEEVGYKQLKVRILCSSGEVIEARTYQWAAACAPPAKPSPHLRMVIEGGAALNNLPIDYFRKLEKIEPSGYRGKVAFDIDLIRDQFLQ